MLHNSYVPIEDPVPLLKEQLRRKILAEVGQEPQAVAAAVLEIDPTAMSRLENGHLERFSLEKLIRILALIDQRVDLHVVNVRKGPLRMFDLRGRGRDG